MQTRTLAKPMFKQVAKPAPAKPGTPVFKTEQVTCGACGHVREATATNPEWQCPCCKAAYAKVSAKPEKRYTKEELRARNAEYLEAKAAGEYDYDGKEMPGWMQAAFIGGLTVLKGLGSACMAANPMVIGAGALIIAGSIGYGLFRFLY